MADDFQYPVTTVGDKNSSPWVYFLDWILSLILALAFIFYFNRLIGFIVSYLLKLVLWKRYQMRITVESLRISLLGGRIFAKNLVFINKDYTISILTLNFSWRYWLFRVTKISDYYYQVREDCKNGVSREENEKLPCRFVLYLEGLEVFMYNRTFAYDNIESMLNRTKNDPSGITEIKSTDYDPPDSSAIAYLLKLMPINVRIKKGTLILGNSTTPSIFVASYKTAYGIIDIHKSPCTLDYFRHIYNFSLDQFQLSMKPNITYDVTKFSKSKSAQISHKSSTIHLNKQEQYQFWHKFHQATKKVARLLRPSTREAEIKTADATNQWRGLQRYVDNEPRSPSNIHLNTEEEYAKYSLILDSTLTQFIYYFDSLGGYPKDCNPEEYQDPEYGVNIELEIATIYYGPWADKQRVPLQQMFFPPLYRDSSPTEPALPGKKRQYQGFKVVMTVKDELIFRVPIREPSKDKEIIRNHLQSDRGALPTSKLARSFGWLELKMAPKSSVCSYTSFTSTKETGWANTLSLFLLQPELRSSVNHDILFTADTHFVECNIGFPLKWNAPCTWSFMNHSTNAKLFLLREHIFLVSDLFADFASGPPPPYENVRPFKYIINWKMDDYKFYLNLNDENIIDNPLDFDSNKYVSFEGENFSAEILIPLNGNLSRSTTVSYKIHTPSLRAVLSTPLWHTVDAFSTTDTVGRSEDFVLEGSYTFFHLIDPGTSNHITIKIIGDFITLKFHGYLIRYLFTARENYFGEHVKFKTFEEYNNSTAQSSEGYSNSGSSTYSRAQTEDDVPETFVKVENDLDVEFVFQVRQGLLILPYNLYNSSSHVAFNFDSFDIDLRFTNYYMDIQADFSPARGAFVMDSEEDELIYDIPNYVKKYLNNDSYEVLIDGLNIHAHRMFGIPPDQITYYCKWDFAAGSIVIDSQAKFLTGLIKSIKCFIFTFKDLENCVKPNLPIVHDAANFSFRCPDIQIRLRPEEHRTKCPIFVIDLGSLVLSMNDLPNSRYNTRISVHLPDISISIVEGSTDNGVRKVLGFFSTSLTLSNFIIKANGREIQRIQRHHVKINDGPFHRCPFLIPYADRDFSYRNALGSLSTNLTLPDVSIPLNRETFETLNEMYDQRDIPYSSLSSSSSSSSSFGTSSFRDDMGDTSMDTYLYDYDDAEYQPEYEKLADTKYGNTIFQFGEIKSFLTPTALLAHSSLMQNFTDFRLETLLDDIEIENVSNIRKLILNFSEMASARLVAPEVTFKFGDFSTSDPHLFFDQQQQEPVLTISCIEPSLAFSKGLRFLGGSESLPMKSATVAGHLKDIFISISNPSSFTSSIFLRVENTEIWIDEDAEGNSTSSMAIDNTDISLDVCQVDFLNEYFKNMKEKFEPITSEHKKQQDMQIKAEADAVYKLSMASDSFKIDHDSAALTKPAYVLRSVADHVRTYDSWKILTRLRHILGNVPTQWEESVNEKFTNLEWEAPQSAYHEVLDVFARWRSWEVDTGDGFLFKRVFNLKDKRSQNERSLKKFAFGNISLAVSKMNEETNRMVFNSANASLETSMPTSDREIHSKAHNKSISILCNVGSYESHISPLILDSLALLEVIRPNGNDVESSSISKTPEHESISSTSVMGTFKILSYSQSLKLPNCHVVISGNDSSLSLALRKAKDFESFILSSQFGRIIVNFHTTSRLIATINCQNMRLNGAISRDKYQGSNMMDFDTELISIHFESQLAKFLKLLGTALKQDLDYIQNHKVMGAFTSPNHSSKMQPRGSKAFRSILQNIKFNLANLHLQASVLEPLRIASSTRNLMFTVDILDNSNIVEFSLGSTEFNLHHMETILCSIENSDTNVHVLMLKNTSNFMLDIDYSICFTKLSFPQVLEAMKHIEASLQVFEDKMDSLNFTIKELRSANNPSGPEDPNVKPTRRQFTFRSNFSIDYFSVSFGIDTTKTNFELENLTSSISTLQIYTIEGEKSYRRVPIYGDLSIPSTRISVIDKQIPLSLSTVVDFNTGIKVSNDLGAKCQTLQLESQYFRIVLSPQVLMRAIVVASRLTRHLNSFLSTMKSSELYKRHFDKASKFEVDKKMPNAPKQKSGVFSQFASIHLLVYNFCLGWVFRLQHKDYPGIIMGAERFFAVTEKNVGKFTLMDAYLSIANGSTSSDFFSMLSERASLNRAFLPNIQLCYFIDEISNGEKNLTLNLSGDELDICFLSSSVLLIERVLHSGTEVKLMLDKMKNENFTSVESTLNGRERSTNNTPFKPWFASVEFQSVFAGANMVLWRNDQVNVSDSPALSLHSPAVKFVTSYTHDKAASKRHIIKTEILASASDNTVYASSVPVITEFANGFRQMMRVSNRDEEVSGDKQKDRRKHLVSNSRSNMTDMLQNFDIHLGLRFENQRLALSCEPTARVEAVVGIDGIYLQINTLQKEFTTFTAAVRLDPVYASLQHIYSREVSASVTISNVVFLSSVELSKTAEVISSCYISDVSGSVDAKQFQDVDLFKDIWFPKTSPKMQSAAEVPNSKGLSLQPSNESLGASKNISSRFKQVSTTYAIPWIFTLVVSKISFQMDVGQLLGNFDLGVNNFWLVSKKSTDWAQDLKIGTDVVQLTSEGRLGGKLSFKDAYLHTAIRWKYEAEALDIPLILVSGGIESLQLKASFDYHVFSVINLRGCSLDIYNQKNEHTISKDHLFATTNIDSAAIYLTSLAASNVIDISNAVTRVIQENKNSYRETLRDSHIDDKKNNGIANAASRLMLETVKKLEFSIEVLLGNLRLYVYPSSLDDTKVLIVGVDNSKAHFQQTEISDGVSNQLDIKFNGIVVSLSVTVPIDPELVIKGTVDEFVTQADKAKGGNIFVFPSLRIFMRTYQRYESHEIEYLFQSAFGGTVEVKWNLGSVNFIREMYANHKRALITRIQYRRENLDVDNVTTPVSEKQDMEKDINDTFAKVTEESSYRYTPLAPPIIEAPQLKELGNATPPLEWFGLHRNRFPDATHQLAIVTLQKFIHQIETQYSKILGKA